jgi:hypothetical protein
VPVAIALCVSAAAVAAPAPPKKPPPTTWADWVGAYTGPLAWTGCTAPGHARATLALDAANGALGIDLAPAGGALRALSLSEDDGGATWSGRDGDLAVTVSRPRANGLVVVVALDSGCTIRAQLRRATSGVPACDALTAWGRVAQRCTKRPLDAALLVASRPWAKADAPACTARATQLAAALVEAGCAPDPDTAARSGPSCTAMLSAAQRLARCSTAPADVRALAEAVPQLVVPAPDDTQRAIVEDQCRAVRTELSELAERVHCSL